MTRNRELDLEDLRDCDHQPQFILLAEDDETVLGWLCACGQKVPPPDPPNSFPKPFPDEPL